jgi:crossover junction endodeoxyribonuclease RuvC
LDSGKIRTDSHQPLGQRLTKIYGGLQQVLRRHDVTGCAVESGFVGHGPQSALLLGQARAAAVLAAENAGVSVDVLAPRQIKMAVTGRGSASKEQVSFMVGKLLGLEFDKGEEDISDALAAALCRILQSGRAPLSRTAG